MDEIKYKKPLSIEEQVDYLEKNKRVVYNECDKEQAKKILLRYNYINVITPYKHRFALKNKKGITIRDDNNNHIYEHDVDFNEYYNCYRNERNNYPTIYKNIMKFETTFNAVLSYGTIYYYNISSEETFLDFINDLHNNLSILESQRTYKQSVINHMNNEIDKLIEDINRYASVYILMDRISLSTAITIFRCCNIQLRKLIFQTLLQLNSTVGYKTFESFDDFLTRLPSVRNFVCHFNSLEVLVNYLYIPTKTLRTPTDRKKYLNIIRKLSQ